MHRTGKGNAEAISTTPRATSLCMQSPTTASLAPADTGHDAAQEALHDQHLSPCVSINVGRSKDLQYDPASPPYEETLVASIVGDRYSSEPSTSRLGVEASADQATTQSVGKPGTSVDCITPPVSDHGALTTATGDRTGPEYDSNLMMAGDATRGPQADGHSAELNSGLTNLSTPSLYAHSGSAEDGEGVKSPMPASPLTELATSPVAHSSGRRPIKYTNYEASPLSPQMSSNRNGTPSTPSRSNGKSRTQPRSGSKELASRVSSAGLEKLMQEFVKGQSAADGVEGEDMRLARELQEQEFGLRRRSR